MSLAENSVAPALMDERQAAAYLNLSTKTLFNLRARGELPHVRIGRRVMYSRPALERWVESKVVVGK